MASLMVILA